MFEDTMLYYNKQWDNVLDLSLQSVYQVNPREMKLRAVRVCLPWEDKFLSIKFPWLFYWTNPIWCSEKKKPEPHMYKDAILFRPNFTINLPRITCEFSKLLWMTSEEILPNGNADIFITINILYKNLTFNASASYIQKSTTGYTGNPN